MPCLFPFSRASSRHRPNAYTCWCYLTGARLTNYGTRLDYIVCDASFLKEQVGPYPCAIA